MSDSLEIMYPEGKKIKVGGEEFTIKPFVLKTRTQVLRVLAAAFLELANKRPDIDPKSLVLMDILPMLIDTFGDKLIGIYSVVLGKDREWLEDHVTLPEEMALLVAISEVNDIPFLISQVKALAGVVRKKTS